MNTFNGRDFKSTINGVDGCCVGEWRSLPGLFLAVSQSDRTINDQDSDGTGMLHLIALGNGSAGIMDLLFAHGADVDPRNAQKDTPLVVFACCATHRCGAASR